LKIAEKEGKTDQDLYPRDPLIAAKMDAILAQVNE
jgi:hypothetical protein